MPEKSKPNPQAPSAAPHATGRSSRQRHRRFLDAYRRGEFARPKTPEGKRERRFDWRSSRGYLRDYWLWLRPFRGSLLFVVLLAVLSGVLALAQPYAPKLVIDYVLENDNLPADRKVSWLAGISLAVLALLVLTQALEIYRGYFVTVLNAKVVFRLRRRFYHHMQHLPLHRLGDMKTGGILSRLGGDIDKITSLLQVAIITPGVAILRIALTLVMLFVINWQLAILATVLIPPVVLLTFARLKKVRPIYRSIREERAEVDARVAETFSGIRVVRAFQRERSEATQFALGHHSMIRKRILAQLYQLIVMSGWGLLIPLTVLLILWYGGWLYLHDRCTMGDVWSFQLYVLFLLHPLSQIVNSYSDTQIALAAMERVFDVLVEPVDKPDPPGARPAPGAVEHIRFEHLWFEYRKNVPVLKDINLGVEAGQTVALIGPSGAGKTTLTDLVARFYDPTRGQILLNGVDLRDIRLKEYRRLLGVVQQDVFLFDGTVRDNIAFSRRRVTEADVIEAAKRAHAHEFIADFPDGYDTLIGERGVKLSGGQRQRIAIARAMLADPQILILDEATSNLDSESEQLIQASLADLLENRTTFVIAHRLSTIRHADVILVIEDGRIVEQGNHESLLAARGRYAEMLDRQVRGAPETADVLSL